MAVSSKATELHIEPLKQGRLTLRMIGTTPLYYNAISAKAQRDFLIGSAKKTAAQRKEIKHDPEEEFRNSVYRFPDSEESDTLLRFPAPGIKNAMATAALETPGVTKTSVRRLIFLPQQFVNVWGRPYLKMDIVRSADMNRTPDIRVRAFLPQWCCEVKIAYVMPTLNLTSIVSLLSNAGVIVGIGDFRQEKGAGSFGTFAVAGAEDMGDWQEDWDLITKQNRAVQAEAMANPEPYDEDTMSLMEMLWAERNSRSGGKGMKIAAE